MGDYPEKDNLNREDYDTPSNYGGALFSGKPIYICFCVQFWGETLLVCENETQFGMGCGFRFA